MREKHFGTIPFRMYIRAVETWMEWTHQMYVYTHTHKRCTHKHAGFPLSQNTREHTIISYSFHSLTTKEIEKCAVYEQVNEERATEKRDREKFRILRNRE